jgi:hypothetical protein
MNNPSLNQSHQTTRTQASLDPSSDVDQKTPRKTAFDRFKHVTKALNNRLNRMIAITTWFISHHLRAFRVV